jgi:single-strand selective monofunctional uracil DNA glycosylase
MSGGEWQKSMPKSSALGHTSALVDISRQLSKDVKRLRFSGEVTHVYHPLLYAREPHERYLERYGKGPKQLLFVGMNPGPFGMAQTGVPFGDVTMVRDFLGITGQVDKPAIEHPKRPVLGFACKRSEVSGTRVWGFVREQFGTPDAFFRHAFVANYCPLCFMESSGKNRTPDQLPVAERAPLYLACDKALRRLVEVLEVRCLIGIGGFAEQRAIAACSDLDQLRVVGVLHPSPANPRANRGWSREVQADLAALGIELGLPPAREKRSTIT